MRSKIIGGILLIVGTSIGGGMLALPMANAEAGFLPSSLALLMCWLLMTLGAFFILEVNLYLPSGKHMVSMAHETLGLPGLIITWISYLLLLYTLLAAYISGGADVFGGLLNLIGIPILDWQKSVLFTICFGAIVYGGIHQVDWTNRGLMFGKLGIYLLLTILIAPYVQLDALTPQKAEAIPRTLMILITSFGFAIIVPNLREYFEHNTQSLKRVIFIGSLIPLICYLAWDMVIMGSINQESLMTLTRATHPTTELANQLAHTVQNHTIDRLFRAFTSICMLTAFLGVSLCLISFLSDGLNLNRRGKQGLVLACITFAPPLLLVLYFPGAYLGALRYAGMLCVVLLLMLPALMVLWGRQKFPGSTFRVRGGSLSPCIVLISACVLLYLCR